MLPETATPACMVMVLLGVGEIVRCKVHGDEVGSANDDHA